MSQSEVLKSTARGAGPQIEIRKATPADTAAIIEVLKASLGESKLKKTREVWNYKHIDNPFGKSLVLVAVEHDQVIGVRAFMRWSWQDDSSLYSAYRAVDTATHPEHQGKGVFKKLTRSAIDLGIEKGDHFIFNTPNTQSMPGYLKMGWHKLGKLQVRLLPTSPFNWKPSGAVTGYLTYIECEPEHTQSLCEKHNAGCQKEKKLFTPKSVAYLKWRYEDNPLQRYEVMAGKDYYLAAYVKYHGRFREFRVVEHLYQDAGALRELKRNIKQLARRHAAHFVSMGNLGESTGSLRTTGHFGPVLTFRNMSLKEAVSARYLALDNWSYALGDLELF